MPPGAARTPLATPVVLSRCLKQNPSSASGRELAGGINLRDTSIAIGRVIRGCRWSSVESRDKCIVVVSSWEARASDVVPRMHRRVVVVRPASAERRNTALRADSSRHCCQKNVFAFSTLVAFSTFYVSLERFFNYKNVDTNLM